MLGLTEVAFIVKQWKKCYNAGTKKSSNHLGHMPPDTKTNPIVKTSRIAAGILLLLLILGIVWFSQRTSLTSDNTSKKVAVPDELILDKEIPGEVKLYVPDPSKVDSAQFFTSKSREELINFYKDWLQKNNFSVIREQTIAQGYFIDAQSQTKFINIGILGSPDSLQKTVTLTSRLK